MPLKWHKFYFWLHYRVQCKFFRLITSLTIVNTRAHKCTKWGAGRFPLDFKSTQLYNVWSNAHLIAMDSNREFLALKMQRCWMRLWMNDANDCCLATRQGTAEKISEFRLVVSFLISQFNVFSAYGRQFSTLAVMLYSPPLAISPDDNKITDLYTKIYLHFRLNICIEFQDSLLTD